MVSYASVGLAADSNPYFDVFATALENVNKILNDWSADPMPAGIQLVDNWANYTATVVTGFGAAFNGAVDYYTQTLPGQFLVAVEQLASGDIAAATDSAITLTLEGLVAIATPLLPALNIPTEVSARLTAVLATLTSPVTLLGLLPAVIGPIFGPIQALGDSAQQFVDALGSGDFGAALGAVAYAPAFAIGAALNGYGDYTGLLNIAANIFQSDGYVYSALVSVPKEIAKALQTTSKGAAPLTEPSDLPAAAAASVDGPSTELTSGHYPSTSPTTVQVVESARDSATAVGAPPATTDPTTAHEPTRAAHNPQSRRPLNSDASALEAAQPKADRVALSQSRRSTASAARSANKSQNDSPDSRG
jgi:hypothetical protein